MRKVRHPHQILEVSEMAIGSFYAFVTVYELARNSKVCNYMFGGVIDDSHAAARARGHDLDSANPQVDIFFDPPGVSVVTVHLDGWRASHLKTLSCDKPTLAYWGKYVGWDCLAYFFGSEEPEILSLPSHLAVVPARRWADDPRMHVLDWENPDDVIERIGQAAESPAEWERMMRKRKHDAMAKILGF